LIVLTVAVEGAGFHDVLLFRSSRLLSQEGWRANGNPEGKRRIERGAGGRAGGTGLHRINRDSLLARPVRDRRL
jgi:hypothetical protein